MYVYIYGTNTETYIYTPPGSSPLYTSCGAMCLHSVTLLAEEPGGYPNPEPYMLVIPTLPQLEYCQSYVALSIYVSAPIHKWLAYGAEFGDGGLGFLGSGSLEFHVMQSCNNNNAQ